MYATLTEPLTLAALEKYGALPPVPPAHEQDGGFSHVYHIWLVKKRGKGFLRIDRAPGKTKDSMSLSVESRMIQDQKTVRVIRAKMECACDRLATPLQWELRSELLGRDQKTFPESVLEQTGRRKQGCVEIVSNGRKRTVPLAGAFTGTWSLFEAVQRLDAGGNAGLSFDLLENLDVLKTGHRLRAWHEKDRPIAGGKPGLNAFVHTGPGILPHEYWVEPGGRLLYVLTGLYAYIFDDGAQEAFERRMAQW
ncbi:MAG: hypothetical protein JXR37_30805 [Kiritimatiellae bacterium]|nr:hypothetical protein [Kiritimatiellia bacterium]